MGTYILLFDFAHDLELTKLKKKGFYLWLPITLDGNLGIGPAVAMEVIYK